MNVRPENQFSPKLDILIEKRREEKLKDELRALRPTKWVRVLFPKVDDIDPSRSLAK